MTSRPRSIAIVVVSTLLAANMLLGLFPPESGPGRRISGSVEAPRFLTGAWQRWDMFHTIPRLHAFEIAVIAMDGEGNEKAYGAWLPGLKERAPADAIRFHYALLRILEPGLPEAEDYIGALRRELRAADPGLVAFTIRLDLDYTRKLSLIREDGRIARRMTHELGPFPIDDGDPG